MRSPTSAVLFHLSPAVTVFPNEIDAIGLVGILQGDSPSKPVEPFHRPGRAGSALSHIFLVSEQGKDLGVEAPATPLGRLQAAIGTLGDVAHREIRQTSSRCTVISPVMSLCNHSRHAPNEPAQRTAAFAPSRAKVISPFFKSASTSSVSPARTSPSRSFSASGS